VCPVIDAVAPIVTRTRIVILRHHSERYRASNSGRLAQLVLPRCELHDVFGPDRHRPGPALGGGAWLLFPEGAPMIEPPPSPPSTLIVLDATWHQARRMRQRLPYLRGYPTLALAPVPAADRMRVAPAAGLVSTIEAIAAALRLLEGDGVAEPLLGLFAAVVARSREDGRRGGATG
jgi:DTW domain-containing protein YfiP